MEEILPSAVLEICVLLGAPAESIAHVSQAAQKGGLRNFSSLDPEVLSVFVPPFAVKDEVAASQTNYTNFNKTAKRRSFRKKKDKFKAESLTSQPEDQKDHATEDISIPKDIDLVGLPQLCFPGGLILTSERKEDHFHFLVFTDVFGNRTYGVVAQYHRPVQNGQVLPNGQVSWDSSGHSIKTFDCYVPFAVCVISKYPYYNALKDCLSCLLIHLKPCKDYEIDGRIKEFAAKLALIPSPPPGPLHLVFNIRPLYVAFPSRMDPDSTVTDLDLHIPLLCFTPDQVLKIMSCILTEHRIVFFSSDWALLTLVAECFMLYLHPLQWQHTFVPILSSHMLDFLMAPTCFLMGCHLDHFDEVVKEADDLILINIDDGTIYSTAGENSIEIPDVPLEAADSFVRRVKGLRLYFDLECAHLNSGIELEELRMRRKIWQKNLNSEIQSIALKFIVSIFRDVKSHLNYEHRVFNSEEFLKTRAPGDQLFYKKVLETVMFHSFLKARLNKRMDAFTRMELSTLSETESVGHGSPRRRTAERAALKRFRPEHMFSKRLVMSMPDLQDLKVSDPPPRQFSLRKPENVNALKIPPKLVHTFRLPEIHFPLMSRSVQSYYVEFSSGLSRVMNNPSQENAALLAQYYYLRGLIYVMQGKLQMALSDFQNLYRTDIRIFPLELVRKVLENMPPSERTQAERKPELKRLICQVMEKEREVVKADDHVKNFELPEKHMQRSDFVKRIQESGIVKDNDTIDRLFDALTVGHQKQIDPETFKDFYNYWKETEAEAQDVNLPPVVLDHLDKTECVYKISCSVKTNYGVGKIAMTQKRLFLLTEGRPGYFEISTFRNIEDVKCTTVAFLVLRIPTLRIKSASRKEIFEANLKSECDLWHLMVKEMVAGRKMADDYKDPQYVQEALTNVLLMDAVVGSLQSSKAIYAATKLSHFDRQKNEVPMMVPKTTSETLKHRINPSSGETVSQSVDVLLYAPGQPDPTERNVEAQPKLWCALSEGKVVVFNAITWSMLQHCFKVGNEKLNCVLGIDHSQVWIGSQNSIIYIINTHSMSCNRQLTDHRSAVVDIIVDEEARTNSEVYTCSSDGTVITWETSNLMIRRTFQLECRELKSVKLIKSCLWCCTRDHIIVTSKDGRMIQKVKFTDDLKDLGSPLHFLQLFPEKGQLWIASSGSSSAVYIWDAKDLPKPPKSIQLPDCTEISCMIKVKNQIWIGSKGLSQGKSKGKIYVIDADKRTVEKELVAHTDAVKSLCSAEDRYVLSGSGREDGKIAIWKVE
ncbi:DENN domain-containing protein 3 [Ambystoma mexicanum]|uniref:DENN domain-containing protein 3 n=1 Tax=Ambystoma mexicanum TaxID=8296 RepID=UPI0037E7BC8B